MVDGDGKAKGKHECFSSDVWIYPTFGHYKEFRLTMLVSGIYESFPVTFSLPCYEDEGCLFPSDFISHIWTARC